MPAACKKLLLIDLKSEPMETRTNEYSRKGAMWELERNLDQPMDAEAGRLRNMYREKVIVI